MDQKELADFLRRRRELLQPTDVGVPAGARRRTPGLRRHEVAQLAGDVPGLLHPAGAGSWPAAVAADADRARAGASAYARRIPGAVFAGSDLYDAIDPVGGPWWSIGMRLHDPSRAEAVAARLNEAGPAPASECGFAPGWCANTSTSIRNESSPFTDQLAQLMLFFAVLLSLIENRSASSRAVSPAR